MELRRQNKYVNDHICIFYAFALYSKMLIGLNICLHLSISKSTHTRTKGKGKQRPTKLKAMIEEIDVNMDGKQCKSYFHIGKLLQDIDVLKSYIIFI